MRRIEVCLGSLLWIAVATLMPMAALEPVAADTPVLASAACAAGCDAVSL